MVAAACDRRGFLKIQRPAALTERRDNSFF
jgi:hypothetical protein